MAKELPYFKFEPNQWENGNIQMCSREDKGLFMDLCSMYWSRLGDVSLKLAIQKLCAGNVMAFDSLMADKIFTIKDGFICIDFLNEQLSDFENTSQQNSRNAKDGWEKRRKSKVESDRNATALNSQSENDAIKENKKKEDNIKEQSLFPEEKPKAFVFKDALKDYGFEKQLVEDWLIVRKNKKASNTKTAFDGFISEIEKRSCDINEVLSLMIKKSWGGFYWSWYDNLKSDKYAITKNTGTGYTSAEQKQSAVNAVNKLFGIEE